MKHILQWLLVSASLLALYGCGGSGSAGSGSAGSGSAGSGSGGSGSGGSGTQACSNEFIQNYRDVSTGILGTKKDKDDHVKKCQQFLDKYGDNFKCMANTKKPGDLDYKEEEVSSADVKKADHLCEKAKL